MPNVVKYDSYSFCARCGKENDTKVVATIEAHVCEVETVCSKCDHKDYWAYGFYESKSEPIEE